MNKKTDAFEPSNTTGRSKQAFLLLLALLMLGSAVFSYTQNQLLTASAHQPLVRLVFLGEALTLAEDDFQDFSRELMALTSDQDAALEAHLEAWLKNESLQIRAQAEKGVNAYLDWYFSLPGSYTRLFIALTGDLDDLLHQRLEDYLLDDPELHALWRDRMLAIQPHLVTAWQSLGEQETETQLQALQQKFQQRQRPGYRELDDEDPRITRQELHWDLQNAIRPSDYDLRRWQISAGSGALAGAAIALPTGRLLASRLAGTPAMAAASRVVRRYLARLPARFAIKSAASGAAAAATSPSGPGALVTGAGIFAAMTAADWALLKAEERRHRGAMQGALLDEFETHFRQVGQQRINNQLASYRQGRNQEAFYLLNRN
ncbi:hypothetical protein SAMN05660443_0980 [Marinospirillum celere]|uniref:Uncharacterized protein n=1 Tax=Marinospirillum celere TaxID=1122252 RepID=A0A1I1FLI4_9GAMM|nr:hypothetical protein [Marinospirillum celere]SFB97973.1 hypothetical protein SAMN05660443_0980 [Marinospirillum celere]